MKPVRRTKVFILKPKAIMYISPVSMKSEAKRVTFVDGYDKQGEC